MYPLMRLNNRNEEVQRARLIETSHNYRYMLFHCWLEIIFLAQNSENKMVFSKERQMCFKRELVKGLYVVVTSQT